MMCWIMTQKCKGRNNDSVDAFGGCLLHDRQPYLRNDYKEIDGDDDGLWGITDRDGEFDLV